MLGGVIEPFSSEVRGYPILNKASERLSVAADLGKHYPNAKVVFSGGSWGLFHTEKKEALLAATWLEWFGLERGRALLEDRARNT